MLGPSGGFNTTEVKFANYLEVNLNNAMRLAVEQARKDGFEIYFADPISQSFLPDHTVCEDKDQRWVNRVDLVEIAPRSESLHPTSKGYAAETDALISWSKALKTKEASPAVRAGSKVPSSSLVTAPQGAVELQLGDVTPVKPEQPLSITMPTLGDRPAAVTFHSEPRFLGTLIPDAKGRMQGYVYLPPDAPYGAHKIVVRGWDKNGKVLTRSFDIEIRPRTPLLVIVIGVAGSLLLIAVPVVSVILQGLRRRGSKGQAAPLE